MLQTISQVDQALQAMTCEMKKYTVGAVPRELLERVQDLGRQKLKLLQAAEKRLDKKKNKKYSQ